MNLAYDDFSVHPLWEEAVDRWGEPAVELQGPTRVQEVCLLGRGGGHNSRYATHAVLSERRR